MTHGQRRPAPMAQDSAAYQGVPVRGVPSEGAGRIARVTARLDELGALGIARRIARGYGASLGDVLGGAHTRAASAARRTLWTMIGHTLDLGWSDLGRIFEVDHTSIIYAVRRREKELEATA